MERYNFNLIYKLLYNHFGFLNWWPGETVDEIIIGAVLTQNTNWKNVEKSLKRLKENNLISIEKIANMKKEDLARLIRPSGFFNQKAQRLINLAKNIMSYGSIEQFFNKDIESLRKELLEINGIGKETADSIILYAANKPIFVIDAYTRRIINRVFDEHFEVNDYDKLQKLIQNSIPLDLNLYKDFHAQFVELAKHYCKKEPLCNACPLKDLCKFSKGNSK